jgi:hypothetical protein
MLPRKLSLLSIGLVVLGALSQHVAAQTKTTPNVIRKVVQKPVVETVIEE